MAGQFTPSAYYESVLDVGWPVADVQVEEEIRLAELRASVSIGEPPRRRVDPPRQLGQVVERAEYGVDG
jgi:hypothetical protein